MEHCHSWTSVEAQVAETAGVWNRCSSGSGVAGPRYSRTEHRTREKAYDEALHRVKREARQIPRTAYERLRVQQRIVDVFPPFATIALGLEPAAVHLLTETFLPVATQLARWARSFDASLSMADTVQACRNAWTACGLQSLLNRPMELTPAILAYSLLYPYSDNHLDNPGLSNVEKLHFSDRFRRRLRGQGPAACNCRESAIWKLVWLIEEQYPRPMYPQVYDCLLAIHRAQEESIAQLRRIGCQDECGDNLDLLRISCAKGGTSVVADACLAQPWMTAEEIQFSFEWGTLLQLGDDLQDVREDLERGSATLFTRAVSKGAKLDRLVLQLLNFSQHVGNRMDRLPNGTAMLKDLLRMSWRSLILMAVADAQQFFSPTLLAELECCSPFRFSFLRARRTKLTGRETLYTTLFDAFIEAGPDVQCGLQPPTARQPVPAPTAMSLSSERLLTSTKSLSVNNA